MSELHCPHGETLGVGLFHGLRYYVHHDSGEACEPYNDFDTSAGQLARLLVKQARYTNTLVVRAAVRATYAARTAFYERFEGTLDPETLKRDLASYVEVLDALGMVTMLEEMVREFGSVAISNILVATGRSFKWVEANVRLDASGRPRHMIDLQKALVKQLPSVLSRRKLEENTKLQQSLKRLQEPKKK